MRSRAPLTLMEQMVMLLVFALAAALCLQAFVKSDEISRRGEARDRAAVLCQNAAEAVLSAGGDLEKAAGKLGVPYPYGTCAGEEPLLSAHYREDWTLSDTRDFAYRLSVRPVDSGVSGLGKASVCVTEGDGSTLFALDIAWQEGGGASG